MKQSMFGCLIGKGDWHESMGDSKARPGLWNFGGAPARCFWAARLEDSSRPNFGTGWGLESHAGGEPIGRERIYERDAAALRADRLAHAAVAAFRRGELCCLGTLGLSRDVFASDGG